MIVAILGKALVMYDTETNNGLVSSVFLPREHLPMNTRQLTNLCAHYRIRHLWIMPYTEIAQKAKSDPETFYWNKYPLHTEKHRVVFPTHVEGDAVYDEMKLLHALIQVHSIRRTPHENPL